MATLTRTTLGRLAAHARTTGLVTNVNTAFVLANWTGFQTSGATTLSFAAASALTLAVNNAGVAHSGAYYNALALPSDHFILTARDGSSGGGDQGVVARLKNASAANDFVAGTIPINGGAGTYVLFERLGGTNLQQAVSGAANRIANSDSVHGLWVRGNLATTRQTSAGGTGVADSTLDLTGLNAGTNGLYGGIYYRPGTISQVTYAGWAAMRSAILRVVGPNTGTWQVRLRDAAGTLIYTSPSHTAGVVDINTLTEMSVLYSGTTITPLMAQIEIYEPATATVTNGPEIPTERLWGGDVWDFTESPPPTATLTRSTFGRIASFGSAVIPNVREAFNATNWVTSGAVGGVSVVSGALRINTTTPNGLIYGRLTNTDAYADGYMQANLSARLRTTDRGGILARHVSSPINYLRFGSNGSNVNITQEVVNNTQVIATSGTTDIAPVSRLHMKFSGTTAAGKKFATAELALASIGLTTAGYFGVMNRNNSTNSSSYCDFDEFYACRGHLLSVTSAVLDGWYFRVKNAAGNVLAVSANASAGSATIDLYAAELALPSLITLEVVQVGTVTVLATVSPTETLWGGDVWNMSFAPSYPESRLVHRKAGAQRLLLKR